MRTVQRTDNPQAFPYACIICGLGKGPQRQFFIDMGFDIAGKYQPLNEGSVYLCNECAPSVVDSLLKILNTYANEMMDNRLLKEEATYGTIDSLTGRPELSGVSATESSRPVSERVTDRGVIQGMGDAENLPDSQYGTSTIEGTGVAVETDESDRTDGPTLEPPTFIMGQRVKRDNRSTAE